ncbi:hypothetical protein [Alteromonas flava]|uniref:hypothetical protein n=1 Tax=Alteromonas flava TaxID=2048003 RepID=UPI000C28CA78|nr:hypothetical protein [Alteromonas flava]
MKYIFIVIALFFAQQGFACTCATPTIEESFKSADYVYIGLIQSAKLNGDTEVINYLSIVKEYKGVRDTDILISDNSESSCASPAAVGYKYLIFGNVGKTPIIQSCSQTQAIFGGKKPLLDKLDKLAGLHQHGS